MPQNRWFEDQIERFPYSIWGYTIGKIVTPFRGPKLPQNIGRLGRCFLPETFLATFYPTILYFKD
jgi:hypothetical protein